MKKRFFIFFFLILPFLNAPLSAQQIMNADFETFDSTPYFYRFGNNSSVNHYPRWQYSHEPVDNPFTDNTNASVKVLKYTSLEARWYGLKFRFSAPANIEDIDTIRFLIYQPENIIGKAVNSTYSTSAATTQEIRVKLLTSFNTVQDSREDAGVVLALSGSVMDFTETGQWVEYKAVVDESKFSQVDLSKFSAGVCGIAIMPAYNSGVTLQEPHICYLDNIRVGTEDPANSLAAVESRDFKLYCQHSGIRMESGISARVILKLYDSKGALVTCLYDGEVEPGTRDFKADLPAGVYFGSLYFNGRFHTYKIIR